MAEGMERGDDRANPEPSTPPSPEKLYELAHLVWLIVRLDPDGRRDRDVPGGDGSDKRVRRKVVAVVAPRGCHRRLTIHTSSRATPKPSPSVPSSSRATSELTTSVHPTTGAIAWRSIDDPRAMAAYKIAAEVGDAVSQFQLGMLLCFLLYY